MNKSDNYIFIDCGSAATRFYLLVENQVSDMLIERKGINSVASKDELISFLKTGYETILEKNHIESSDLSFVMAAGMITSNMGIKEVVHQTAPSGLKEIWDGIDVLEVEKDSPFPVPMMLIRGIKNAGIPEKFEDLQMSDLMRGEELQTVGVLEICETEGKKLHIVELGSTTKLIEVDDKKRITGSFTSLSGQVYQAIQKETFIGGSVSRKEGEEKPEGYFDSGIVTQAMKCVENNGFLRSVMLVRFSDVLLNYKWYERELFFSSLFAADDKNWLCKKLKEAGNPEQQLVYLVGNKSRCQIYEEMIRRECACEIKVICDQEMVNQLAVKGAQLLVRTFKTV